MIGLKTNERIDAGKARTIFFSCWCATSLDMVRFMYYPRLKDLREDKELKQKEIADILGIDQRVYSNYEIGKREIPTGFIIKLARYYKTSADFILGLTNNPKPYE